MQSQTATVSYSSTKDHDSNLSSSLKYGGLLEVSGIKKIRNNLVVLFAGMDFVISTNLTLQKVIAFFRFLQFIGPAFWISNRTLWNPQLYVSKFLGYISIIFQLIPEQFSDEAGPYLLIIASIILILFFFIIIILAFHYQKTAKLSSLTSNIVSIFMNTFGYLAIPIMTHFWGELLIECVLGENRISNGISYFGLIISFLAFCMYLYFTRIVKRASILFKPDSLLCVEGEIQQFLIHAIALVTVVMAVGARITKGIQIVFGFLGVCIYFLSIFILEMGASFVSKYNLITWISICIAGSLICLLNTIIILANVTFSEMGIWLFIYFAIIILTFGITTFLTNTWVAHTLMKLDELEMFQCDFTGRIHSPRQASIIGFIGFAHTHPVCMDWSFFKAMITFFPTNLQCKIHFAKFVAIYPEESHLLEWIVSSISNSSHSFLAKTAIEHISAILRQRESNLSASLKKKLGSVSKSITYAQQKLASVWDLVIQGNTHEMQNAIMRTAAAIEKGESEINRLMLQYPNNRFVARGYLRFLLESKGDQLHAKEWNEKVRSLMRGMNVQADIANTFGLMAIPNIPPTTQTKVESAYLSNQEITNTQNDESDILDDSNIVDVEEFKIFVERINHVKIPSVRISVLFGILCFLILVCMPAIVLYAIHPSFSSSLSEPLDHIYSLSYLRNLFFMLPTMLVHDVLEHLPRPSDNLPILQPIDCGSLSMESFAGAKTSREMLTFVVKQFSPILLRLQQFREFDSKNSLILKAQDICFSPVTFYTYYDDPTSFTEKNVSLYDISYDFMRQTDKLLSIDTFTPADINTSILLNFPKNLQTCVTRVGDAIDLIIQFIDSEKTSIELTYTVIEGICISVIVILLVVYITVANNRLSNESLEIYRALTALPKNVVSTVAEGFRSFKRSETNTKLSDTDIRGDVNRQEESTLKTFAAANDGDSSFGAQRFLLFCGSLFMIAGAIVADVMLCELFKKEADVMQETSPHLDTVLGAYGYTMGSFSAVNFLILLMEGYDMFNLNTNNLTTMTLSRLTTATSFYHRMRFGGNSTVAMPFTGVPAGRKHVAEKLLQMCPNPSAIMHQMIQATSCFSADQQINLFEPLIKKFIWPYIHGLGTPDSRSDVYGGGYSLCLRIYDAFFFPMFETIVPDTRATISAVIPLYFGVAAAFLVVALVGLILILVKIKAIDSHMRFSLQLLYHYPMQAVMATSKIHSILNGDFSNSEMETATRTDQFFVDLMKEMPDSVIIYNTITFQIISINKAASAVFKLSHEESIKRDVRDLLCEKLYKFDPSILDANGSSHNKSGKENVKDKEKEKDKFLDVTMHHDDHTESFFEMSVKPSAITQACVVNLRDISLSVQHERLINEEHVKSDMLLSSILPAAIVKRVQSGETGISFAVQSSTVLFLDIVEFTPWCAANTAATVMSTLNLFFGLLDGKLAEHRTLTKIKCIGDCYMAAGGLFDTVNQPVVHAKEMVEFGLEAIASLEKLDQENNLDRRIRVGVNTGGPLVAGVLGVGKPTFEIIGPTINMAQQMEHTGVPMKVHISRATYELIYGGSFIVKERGEIQIKSGMVSTYIVEGVKNDEVPPNEIFS